MADKSDNTLYEGGIGWAIMLVILGILLWLFWYYHATEVRDMIRWVRYGEMWLISWFLGPDYEITFNSIPVKWWQGFDDTDEWQADALTFDHLSYFTTLAMHPLKYIFVALMIGGGLWCMFFGPKTQYRRHLTLEGLLRHQAKNFPIISPFVKFNPSEQPPRPPGVDVPAELPPFAEALGPEEWLAYNSIPAPDGKIDEAATARAFEAQLGGRWKGPNALERYQQVLLAAFCLKASRKRGDADDMMGRLARCFGKDGLKLSRDSKLVRDARTVLKNSKLSAKTLSQANRHAFVTTALLRALAYARQEGGVLAPAQFVWLRAHDRALWYPLNNLGRQSFHMEALGAMAHYKAEKLTQRPIPVPKVGDAVKTIKEYMESNRARPIPALDYSNSKKKGIKMAR